MNIKCEFDDKGLYVLARVMGTESSVKDVMDYAQLLEHYFASSRCKKILLDERQLNSNLTLLSEYESASMAAKKALGFFLKIACVPNEQGRRNCADFELFSNNRGLNYKWFYTIEEAEQWLREEE